MAGLVQIPWYATVMHHDSLAEKLVAVAPLVLRYGATQYSVQRSRDDYYRITQMAWFEQKADWYRYWNGPEMIEFRRRNSGQFQVPVTYVWHDELAAGALGPEVGLELSPEPQPDPEPQVAA